MNRVKTPRHPKVKAARQKKRDYSNFDSYIYKVLKQIHPDTGINSSSMGTINAFAINMIMIISQNINVLKEVGGSQTVTTIDVQSATRLSLPGELSKHAVTEGNKAVTKFTILEEKGKIVRRKEKRSGLVFPVSRIENMMRKYITMKRMGESAPVFMTAVIEYLVSEILELSGNASIDLKKRRISNRHILLAMENDEELREVIVKHCLLLPGGVTPFIHAKVLPDVRKNK